MAETMKWFGLAFLLLLGFTEGQNGGIDPQCNIIAEEVLQLKQPLIAQLKTFADDYEFQRIWKIFFADPCFYLIFMCDEFYDPNNSKNVFSKRVKPFQIKGEILNVTRNVAEIIYSYDRKLNQYEKRKFEILDKYYRAEPSDDWGYNEALKPFGIFARYVNNYDSLASASRCEPCTDANEFSSCLYKELNKIKEGLAIFQEVAVSRRDLLLPDTIDLLIEEFQKFPNITKERITDFYKNTVFIREEKRYISDLEGRYDWYLRAMIRDSVNNFTQLVQTILEPACTQHSCVGNVLKDVITQIKPYLTPIAKTLPRWNFNTIVTSYVKPGNLTDINLIERFEQGFSSYRDSIFPKRQDEYRLHSIQDYYNADLNNPYSTHISSIIRKGFAEMRKCPDFRLIYDGNSDFKYFMDKGNIYNEKYVMGFSQMDYYWPDWARG